MTSRQRQGGHASAAIFPPRAGLVPALLFFTENYTKRIRGEILLYEMYTYTLGAYYDVMPALHAFWSHKNARYKLLGYATERVTEDYPYPMQIRILFYASGRNEIARNYFRKPRFLFAFYLHNV